MNVRQTLDALLEATAYKAGAEARISRLRSLLSDAALREFDEMGAAPSWKAKGSGTVRLDVPDEKPVVVDVRREFRVHTTDADPEMAVTNLLADEYTIDAGAVVFFIDGYANQAFAAGYWTTFYAVES